MRRDSGGSAEREWVLVCVEQSAGVRGSGWTRLPTDVEAGVKVSAPLNYLGMHSDCCRPTIPSMALWSADLSSTGMGAGSKTINISGTQIVKESTPSRRE